MSKVLAKKDRRQTELHWEALALEAIKRLGVSSTRQVAQAELHACIGSLAKYGALPRALRVLFQEGFARVQHASIRVAIVRSLEALVGLVEKNEIKFPLPSIFGSILHTATTNSNSAVRDAIIEVLASITVALVSSQPNSDSDLVSPTEGTILTHIAGIAPTHSKHPDFVVWPAESNRVLGHSVCLAGLIKGILKYLSIKTRTKNDSLVLNAADPVIMLTSADVFGTLLASLVKWIEVVNTNCFEPKIAIAIEVLFGVVSDWVECIQQEISFFNQMQNSLIMLIRIQLPQHWKIQKSFLTFLKILSDQKEIVPLNETIFLAAKNLHFSKNPQIRQMARGITRSHHDTSRLPQFAKPVVKKQMIHEAFLNAATTLRESNGIVLKFGKENYIERVDAVESLGEEGDGQQRIDKGIDRKDISERMKDDEKTSFRQQTPTLKKIASIVGGSRSSSHFHTSREYQNATTTTFREIQSARSVVGQQQQQEVPKSLLLEYSKKSDKFSSVTSCEGCKLLNVEIEKLIERLQLIENSYQRKTG